MTSRKGAPVDAGAPIFDPYEKRRFETLFGSKYRDGSGPADPDDVAIEITNGDLNFATTPAQLAVIDEIRGYIRARNAAFREFVKAEPLAKAARSRENHAYNEMKSANRQAAKAHKALDILLGRKTDGS